MKQNKIILASTSKIRQELLQKYKVDFQACKSPFDEEKHKNSILNLSPSKQALFLAQGKAMAVSKNEKNSVVLGCDQICYLEESGQIMNKPLNKSTAINQLKEMSGKKHTQNCATVIMINEKVVWENIEICSLTMRNLSQEEIINYINLDNPINACGSYHFEAHGKHLFSKVEGDHDAIMGIPMVSLLNFFYETKLIKLI
jgi:septum formation protein